MHTSLEAFLHDVTPLLEAFAAWVNTYQPLAVTADHFCYKCGSTVEFEHLRALLEQESVFVYQSFISKRRIAIIKLRVPLKTPVGEIGLLELSDQKPDGSQKSGFDHIEIYPNNGFIEPLVHALEEKGMLFEKILRPHHTTLDGRMGAFLIRLEEEPLLRKILREELQQTSS